MGVYINPTDMTKEKWLRVYGSPITNPPSSITDVPGYLPVCLVYNPLFTAAGIAYSDGELSVFANPQDARPKEWYFVRIENLLSVQPSLEPYMSSIQEDI